MTKIASSFDPDQAGQNVGPDLDRRCLAFWWYSWMIYFRKFIMKISAGDVKSMKNYPACKE